MNKFKGVIINLLVVLLLMGLPLTTLAQPGQALPVANINSEYDELMPVVAPDGQTLFFVRTGHPQNTGGAKAGQDIWFSQKNKAASDWQTPINPGAPLNNIYNNAVSGLSPNGQIIYLNNRYLPRNRMAPGLSVAGKTSAGWGAPQPVTIQQFAPEFGFLNFYPATDSILFLSVQTDTTHLEDLFICRRIAEKEWSVPERLNYLNTTGFEIAPVLAPDGQTLYFTSNGHSGFGDADIFRSRRLDNTWLNWSQPENLGPAVNTPGFDGYFTLDNINGHAYFTRENEEGNTDIYFVRLDDITATDNATATAAPGAWSITKPETEAEPAKSQPSWPVLIFFEINSADLNPAAQTTLQMLNNQLRANKYPLLILGHADDTGTEARNQVLSERRAKVVADYLVTHGWPDTAIQAKSFGSRQPMVPNQSAQDRAKNRRVEIRIE